MVREKLLDFSSRGWGRVVAITLIGTLICIAVPVSVDLIFMDFSGEDLRKSLRNDILLPILLAVPLLGFLSWKMRQLAIAHARLQIVASTDSLTAVLNRGAFNLLVDSYLAAVRQQQAKAEGALLIVDADHFKSINDQFGHDSGDEALRIIADAIRGLVRGADLVGRIGGEEFGVFLPGSDSRQAEAVAERIRTTVNTASFTPNGVPKRLSVSVGGAIFSRDIEFSELYRLADQQLYHAKQTGRDRVVITPVPERGLVSVAFH
jgi:diguanylate cyclase (GGDEF)-like protein